MKRLALIVSLLLLCAPAFGQQPTLQESPRLLEIHGDQMSCSGKGWQAMDTAPHDGTVIELCKQNADGFVQFQAFFQWNPKAKTWRRVTGKQLPFVIDEQRMQWRRQ